MTQQDARRATEIDVRIGARLRTLRLLAGISQDELANKIGITFQQVQKYEKGTNRYAFSRGIQIAEVLGVSLDDLKPDGGDATADGSDTSTEGIDLHDLKAARDLAVLPVWAKITVRNLIRSLRDGLVARDD